jgi:hypothetical protein
MNNEALSQKEFTPEWRTDRWAVEGKGTLRGGNVPRSSPSVRVNGAHAHAPEIPASTIRVRSTVGEGSIWLIFTWFWVGAGIMLDKCEA